MLLSLKRSLIGIAIAAMVLALVGNIHPVAAATIIPLASIQAGDLVRGQTFPAVYYYGRDGFRYVFPNDKAYFTWYSNFDTVKWLTDADLAKVQIGGNVTYKPGVKMIKINSDPKTYAISRGGMLRWVPSESIAVSLYGSTWNKKIDDVPDGFFSNYKSGADIELATDFNAADESAGVTNIDSDKSLKAPVYVEIMNNAFAPSTVTVSAGTAVRFVNKDGVKHTATADDISWGTGTLESGGNFTRYFKTPGTYTYFCSYHPDMKGTIVVQ